MGRISVRKMWQAKLEGRPMPAGSRRSSRRAGVSTEPLKLRGAFSGLVLGIDPSLRGTGLAVIDFQPGRTPVLLQGRTIRVPATRPLAMALAEIHRGVEAMLRLHAIRHVALEQTIYVQNFQTAQVLGAARGAAIAVAALQDKPVFEYPPLRVKQAVVGTGRASKEQLARTVMALLGHGRTLAPDEADAAGVALCHAFTWRP